MSKHKTILQRQQEQQSQSKVCADCHTLHPYSDYAKNKHSYDHLTSRCKKCIIIANKKYRSIPLPNSNLTPKAKSNLIQLPTKPIDYNQSLPEVQHQLLPTTIDNILDRLHKLENYLYSLPINSKKGNK
jgi:hypothetical protein